MVFHKLREIKQFTSRHLSFINSQEDWDILVSVGYAQETGRPITYKQLTLERICPGSTLQRRVNRLVELGVLKRERKETDGRLTFYTITEQGLRPFRRYYKTFLHDTGGQNQPTKDSLK